MAVQVTVDPSELRRLGERLERLGRQGLVDDLAQGITDAVKPLASTFRQSALATLPRRGGLAQRVAGTHWAVVQRRTGRTARVSLRGQGTVALRRLDLGQNRHPTFGRPNSWQPQQVRRGWLSRPADAAKPAVLQEIRRVVDRVAAEVERGGR